MKRLISLGLSLLLVAVSAYAQNAKLDLVGTPMLLSLSGNKLTVGTEGSNDLNFMTNNTLRFALGGASGELLTTGQSCTAAATPVAGTNDAKGNLVIIPTVAANAACILPTPAQVGIQKLIVNTGGNTVRIKAGGTNTINGATAGGWLPITASGLMDCESTSTTNWACDNVRAAPTPQGP